MGRVQVGSALAYSIHSAPAAYCGAKHAIVGFTDSIRSELIHDGSHVHITVVQMPALKHPSSRGAKSNMGRRSPRYRPYFSRSRCRSGVLGRAQRHREVFVGWPTVRAIWGQRFIPGILDHLAARLAWDGELYGGEPDPDRAVDLYAPCRPSGRPRRLRQAAQKMAAGSWDSPCTRAG